MSTMYTMPASLDRPVKKAGRKRGQQDAQRLYHNEIERTGILLHVLSRKL